MHLYIARVCFRLAGLFALTFALGAQAAPNAPTGLNVTNVKAISLTLRWSAATGGTGGITAYEVYRDGTLAGSSSTRLFNLTGLAPQTAYTLTVVARDGAGGVSPPSAPLLVTTTADVTDPGRPTALAATAITTTSFSLAWTAPADNVGVTGYNIYRAGTLVGTASATSFNVTGLAADTRHRMTVRAFDAAGNLSSASLGLTVRTLADPPSVPTGLTAASLKPASFTLKWTASTGGTGGIAAYEIYQDGILAGTTPRKSFAFTGLTPLTTYSLAVAARDHEGRVSAQSAPLSVTTLADTTKPSVPKDLSAADVTHQSFTLRWTPSKDNVAVTGYDVLLNGAVIGSTAVPPYAVSGLASLTTYTVRVKARDAAGNVSGQSAALSVTTAAMPNAAPAVVLTAPVTGSTFTLPHNLTLTATATDSDGTVTRVEFFDGPVSLGAVTAPSTPPATFTLPVTLGTIGQHDLLARATDNRNATTDSAPVTVRLLPGLPYLADFEEAEGYLPGTLHDQQGWSVATGTAQVTANDSTNGTQSVLLEPGASVALADQEIGPGAINPSPVFVDVFVHPVAGATPGAGSVFDLDNARLALFYADLAGRFAALDGDGAGGGAWQTLIADVALDSNHAASAWHRLTVRLDYTAKTWDAYVDGRLVAHSLRFRHDTATYFSGVSLRGHPALPSGFDDLYAGPENPLFTDADRDGIDDAWETAHGLNPNLDDRLGDIDSDGISNIEEYRRSLDAAYTDTDADGLADEWEERYFGDLTSLATDDSDQDGLTNLQEQEVGTDPTASDTDADGMLDGRELLYGRSPLKGVVPDTTGAVNLRVFQPGN